jgi:hypothetical protein
MTTFLSTYVVQEVRTMHKTPGRSLVIFATAAMLVSAVAFSGPGAMAVRARSVAPTRTVRGIEFRNEMRKLWEDHITWTRLFIVSFVHDLPDLQPTTARLLRNQHDIGDAIEPYFGAPAADRLTALLREHILLAAKILGAAKEGKTERFRRAVDAWYENAHEIARFLHEANPAEWPLEEMDRMMREHLDLTLKEASDRLAGNYAADVRDYDAIHRQILRMADMLSLGIIRHFRNRFA